MVNKIKNDLRIDKRIRAVFGQIDFDSVTRDPADTEGILIEQESESSSEEQ